MISGACVHCRVVQFDFWEQGFVKVRESSRILVLEPYYNISLVTIHYTKLSERLTPI